MRGDRRSEQLRADGTFWANAICSRSNFLTNKDKLKLNLSSAHCCLELDPSCWHDGVENSIDHFDSLSLLLMFSALAIHTVLH